MGMKRSLFFWLPADGGVRRGQRPGAAAAGDAAGANRPAVARARQRMRADASAPRHGTMRPQGTTTGEAGEPLGDRLARSDGVLCPPAGVDPEMRAPTPDAGNTPVIPPPGSPGGDPNVRPK